METPPNSRNPLDTAPVYEKGLTALATRRPVAVTMVVLTVMIFGVISFQRLPRNLMPDISYPSITVRTEYPGASPLDVETRVSRRLEEVLAQVRGLSRVGSISRAQISDVILEFAWDTNMSLATMAVREKIEQVQLPDEVIRPTILRYDPTLDPILQIGFYRTDLPATASSSEVNGALIELRLVAEDLVERELEKIDGVAAVRVRGGLEREIRIEVVEDRLRDHDLDIAVINRRLREENLNQASGLLYEGDQSYLVRTVNEFRDLDEIRAITLRSQGSAPLRLRDVATVTLSYREPEVITRIDGNPCVKVDIYKEADANVVTVAKKVKDRIHGTEAERERLEQFEREEREERIARTRRAGDTSASRERSSKKGDNRQSSVLRRPNFLSARLDKGMQLEVMSDQSVFIENALDNVRRTGISGGLLAVLVLFLFIRNAWFTVTVGLSIPISVIAAFIALHVFDVSLNMMSLGGLALGIGMLVDNSIVVLESIFRCREEGDELRPAAIRGTREVAGAVIASTLTTVCVFFPIVFVEGIAGQVFRDQALAVVLSLIASLLVALYLIPSLVCRRINLGQHSGGRPPPGFDPAPYHQMKRRLEGLTEWLRRRSLVSMAIVSPPALIAAGLAVSVMIVGMALETLRCVITALLWWLVSLAMRSQALVKGNISTRVERFFHAWDRMFEHFRRAYARLLGFCLTRRGGCVASVLLVTYISWLFFGRLGSELIPEVHQGEFTVDVRLPVGTRIERSEEIIRPLERAILAGPLAASLQSLTTTIGVEKNDVTAGDQGEHTARLLVRLLPGRDPLAAEEAAKRSLRELFRHEPALASVKFENPVLFSFKTPIEVEVKGYDLRELRRITEQIEAALKRIPALKDVKTNIADGYPEVHLRLDREIMSRYDLTVQSVGELVRNKLQGNGPTAFTDGDRKIDLRVRLVERDRETVEQLRGLIVNSDSSVPLRLSDVAQIEVSEGLAEIRRIGHQRAGLISANLTGTDLGQVVEDVEAAIKEIPRPAEFLIGFGGQKAEMDRALGSLVRALVLAVFLVFVVLAIQFESLIQPFVIIAAVPLAMVGVSPVLWAFDISLNVVTFIGMIVLAGIVVNNAIVLVDRINQLRSRGLAVREAIIEAGKARLRPILMTTVTTVLGLLPLTGVFQGIPGLEAILGTGEGAEIRIPLAVTVIAGLVTSTFLTLLVVPVIYSLVAARRPATRYSAHDFGASTDV